MLTWVPLALVFALTDFSVKEGPTGSENVFGPNMAIRAEIFTQGHRFDTSIGPRDGNYAMGSESELLRRLVRQGHSAWHVHDAVVEHFIREAQLSQSWILQRAVRYGRGQYRMARAVSPLPSTSWWGVPRYLVRELFTHAIRAGKGLVSLNQGEVFRARWELNYIRGEILEARSLRRERAA